MNLDLATIETRKKTLESTRQTLKAYFIGIDQIIDDLLDYIQIWYLMPEILSRPIIVNLWGMTGVGKTDLVRRLVKCLDFQDRFAEVELSNTDATGWMSSVSSVLESNSLSDSNPAIVLFDEIQRFNTLDTDGKPLHTTKFMDFWELLSDGRLSRKERSDLDYYLNDYMFQTKENRRRRERGEEVEEENATISFWEAQQMKRMFQMDNDLDELTDMTRAQMIDLIKVEKKRKRVYEPVDHSKTLIIISGNLDEAFEMSHQISEADIDADIFHAYTKQVTLVDVKNALSRKFRPEQVARFGNIHLIYTSLRRADFEQLITREIEKLIVRVKERFDIAFQVDSSIHDLVYRNGVFPVQGVRPVFSSIIDIIETNLSKLLFDALMGGTSSIALSYDANASELITKVGNVEKRIPYTGRIDRIRESNVLDNVANISVHESGHAVAYMALFGLAPLQLKSKLASSYAGGFTFPHQIFETCDNLLRKTKVFLAGGIAEELIFGKSNASIGRSQDRESVTTMIVDFVRRYGFSEVFQSNYTLEFAYSMDKDPTDTYIEQMIQQLVKETIDLLEQHKSLLMRLSTDLCLKGNLSPEEVAVIAQEYGLNVLVKEEGYLKLPEYHDLMTNG